MASKTKLDKNLLKGLEPLASLSNDKLEELASKSLIEDLPAGRILFRQGERDNRILYLINGQVELSTNGEKKPQIIKGKTPDARQPLGHGLPRPSTAKARGSITLLTVDPDLLEIIMDDTPLDGTQLEVTEISGDDTTDWMLRFLQSRAFLKLPTESIQAILMRMEEMPVKKGQVIISQGQKDDYYYIVQSGSCAVSRRPAPKAKNIDLATLNEGAGFGEEALITNGKRNATVTMLEDGVLMRLNKKDFLKYLAGPLISRLNDTEVLNKVSGGALLIDVRSHESFLQHHVEGSVNIPLSMLRIKLEGLNPHREYVLACADGTQSAAASFLLTQHGFTTSILDGGLNASQIKLSDVPRTAAVSAAPSSKRTKAAEKTRKAAEDRARKITQEADTARREAEKLAQQTASAEQAKRQAEEKLKHLQSQQKAAETATRQKAEQARLKAEQELKKIQAAKQANDQKQQELDKSLQRAQHIATEASQAADQSRKQAEKEAEEIRRKAIEEAEQLKREMENMLNRFSAQANQAQEQEEAQRQAAIEQARHEAEEIKRKAVEEAEQLRREMEQTRKQVMEHAARAQQEAEQQARRDAEQQARRAAQQQAEREAEQRARREAEEQARREAQQQAEREAEQQRLEAEREARRQQAIRHAQSRNKQLKRHDEARRMAEEIKAKLEAAERERQEQEEQNRSEGLSVARATIKRKDGKIILEGDQDIFIFKEPTESPEQIEAELAAEPAPQVKDELPSFEIDEPTKTVFKPANTQAVHAKLAERHASNKHQRKKRHLFALAATLLLALGSGGVYVFMHPELVSQHLMAKATTDNSHTKTTASVIPNKDANENVAKQKREKSLRTEAEARFNELLKEWQEITSR